MLKLNASFSKKVPVAGQEFSSQSYHASVETELPDGLTPEQLQDRIHQTFLLVRTSVESELRNGAAQPVAPNPAQFPAQTPTAIPKASGKQVKYLMDLAISQKMDVQTLNARASQCFGIADINQLNRKQASDLIDMLNGKEAHRRAA
ncbi:MAG: hypothetical protein HOJ57_43215 [Lentisphaerae bacterium]|jgi:hypothetical protein|nr:hypothetical protein [Lentisphaerota bacterium]